MADLAASANALSVGVVRVHGAHDSLRARRCLEAELARVDPIRLGLPPAAVLVVRRVAPAARLPSTNAGMAGAFGLAVHAELLRKAAQARRPWIHVDAAEADCVVFHDEAELAACLVCDWLRGSVTGHWWWRCVLGRLTAAQWLDRNVLARGELLPAVMERLAGRGQAIRWTARLSESAARRAATAVALAHGTEIPLDFAVATRPADSSALPARGAGPARAGLPTLLRHVPELRIGPLGPMRSALLAIALVVRRVSAWAHTAEFSAALRELRTAAQRGSLERNDADVLPAARGLIRRRSEAFRGEASFHEHSWLPESAAARRRPNGRARSSRDDAIVERSVDELPILRGSQAGRPGTAPSVATEHDPARHMPTPQSRAPPGATERPPEPVLDLTLASSLETRFGGLFYLLNVALALRLYGDFTAPRAVCLALSPWDWLAFVGAAWFGREFHGDPLASLLAKLAGRRRRAPPRSFRLPRDWVPPDDWKGLARRTRVRLGGKLRPADLLAYMKCRLARALGIDDQASAPSIVCRHAARVRITSNHVDVSLSLSGLPLAIRRAGLDRDPGWIPAAGRAVRLHFE